MKNYFLLLLSVLLLVSCGKKLTPESTQIKGDLSEYLVLADKSYKPATDSKKFIVEVQRTNLALPEDVSKTSITLTIEYIDKDGTVIAKEDCSGDEADALLKLDRGESGTVTFRFPSYAEDAVSFRVSCACTEGRGIFGLFDDLVDTVTGSDDIDDDAAEDIGAVVGAVGEMVDATVDAAEALDKKRDKSEDAEDIKKATKVIEKTADVLKALGD